MSSIIIFKPTSTKPQAGKLGLTYKIMVATAIYSVIIIIIYCLILICLQCSDAVVWAAGRASGL